MCQDQPGKLGQASHWSLGRGRGIEGEGGRISGKEQTGAVAGGPRVRDTLQACLPFSSDLVPYLQKDRPALPPILSWAPLGSALVQGVVGEAPGLSWVPGSGRQDHRGVRGADPSPLPH